MKELTNVLLSWLILISSISNIVFAQNCIGDSFNVQANFDFEKFMGIWYEMSWYSEIDFPRSTWFTDYSQTFLQTGEGNATIYAKGRRPITPKECFHVAIPIATTDTPGKFQYDFLGTTTPYWVMETDYTEYAFTYSCQSVSSNGTCGGARAWVWSRNTTLTQRAMDKLPDILQRICIPMASFVNVTFNNSCAVRTHWRVKENQDCKVNSIPVQEDFNTDRYAGTWYETRWLPPFFIPSNELVQDYQHHYVITVDGNITTYNYGRSSDNCFYRNAQLQKTSTPGKFIYVAENEPKTPYWVLKTDYTQYSVVYGCFNVSSNGTCYQARSWVWSRTPTLSPTLEYEINSLLQDICVNPSAYLSTQHTDICPLRPIWSLYDKMDCNVTSFEVKSNFSVEMFTRVWYETHSLVKDYTDASELSSDYQEEVFTDEKGHLTSYVRYRKGATCHYSTKVDMKTDTPGKFVYSASLGESVHYWVADTDYTNYAVLYGCERVGSDGGCLSALAAVWSRSPTLVPEFKYKANTVLQGLCINPIALVARTHDKACPPQEVKKCPAVTGASCLSSGSYIGFVLVLLSPWLH